MSVVIPPLPQYAFMAWCLVKAQRQPYFYLFTSMYLNIKGFQKQVVRTIFGHKRREEATGGWRKCVMRIFKIHIIKVMK